MASEQNILIWKAIKGLVRPKMKMSLITRDGYRLHFIDTDTIVDTIWCKKLFYNFWTLATVLKFFSQEQ